MYVVILSVNLSTCQNVHLNMFDHDTVQVACRQQVVSKSIVFSRMIVHLYLSNFLVVTVSQMLKECVYCLLHFCEARRKEQVVQVTLFLCIILRLTSQKEACKTKLVIGYGLGNMKKPCIRIHQLHRPSLNSAVMIQREIDIRLFRLYGHIWQNNK